MCRYKQHILPDQPHYDRKSSLDKHLYALSSSDTYDFDIKVWKMETERTDYCGNCTASTTYCGIVAIYFLLHYSFLGWSAASMLS
jgi:hypothetical protein